MCGFLSLWVCLCVMGGGAAMYVSEEGFGVCEQRTISGGQR